MTRLECNSKRVCTTPKWKQVKKEKRRKMSNLKDALESRRETAEEERITAAKHIEVYETLLLMNKDAIDIGDYSASRYTKGISIAIHSFAEFKLLQQGLREAMPKLRLKLSDYYGQSIADDDDEEPSVTLTYDDIEDSRVRVILHVKESEIPKSLIPKSCKVVTHHYKPIPVAPYTYSRMECQV